MADDLEALYQDARAALKARDYDHAGTLLKQILVIDEDYKDASRLLAQTVQLKRRRWYNDPRLLSAAAGIVLMGVAAYLIPRLTSPRAADDPMPISSPIMTPLQALTASPAPMAIPLVWKRISVGQEFPRDMVAGLAIDDSDSDVLYARMQAAGTFRSIDGGESWQPIDVKTLDRYIATELQRPAPEGEPAVTVKTADGALRMYTFTDSSLRVQDPNGSNQVRLGDPGIGSVATVLLVPASDPDTVLVGGEGLSVSRNGGMTWTSLNNGLGTQQLELVLGPGDQDALFVLVGPCLTPKSMNEDPRQPLYVSADAGRTWEHVPQVGCQLVLDADGKTLYRLGHVVWLTNELGQGWIWRSPDGGKTWQKSWTPEQVLTMTADMHQAGRLQFQGGHWFSPRNPQFTSDDYGRTWKRIESGVVTRPCSAKTLHFVDEFRATAVDPFDADHVLYVAGGALTESYDSCGSTRPVDSPPAPDLNTIAFDTRKAGTLYAGGASGAYVSTDGGGTWGQINDGLLGATVVYSIVVDKTGNVYAATPYGVFRLEAR